MRPFVGTRGRGRSRQAQAPPGAFPLTPFIDSRRPLTRAETCRPPARRGAAHPAAAVPYPLRICSRPSSASPTCGIRPSGRTTAARKVTIPRTRSRTSARAARPEVGQPRRAEEQLGHEAVIRNRRFVIGAVRQDLDVQLLCEPFAALPIPGCPRGRSSNTAARKNRPDDVAEKVVAGDLVGVLEMALDERAVIEQRLVHLRQKAAVSSAHVRTNCRAMAQLAARSATSIVHAQFTPCQRDWPRRSRASSRRSRRQSDRRRLAGKPVRAVANAGTGPSSHGSLMSARPGRIRSKFQSASANPRGKRSPETGSRYQSMGR